MKICESAEQMPVYLLRKGAVLIVSSKTSLYMSDWYSEIICSQAGSKSCCCIPLHQNYVGLLSPQNVFKTNKSVCCYIKQILIWTHDIKVIIRGNIKYSQYLIKHLSVLCGNTNNSF